MLVNQFISDISTSIRAISQDSYIPPRFIYYEAQNIIADFLKKDNDAKKKLSRVMEGWSEIDCIELEEIPTIQCSDVDARLCDKMMKSVNKIPASYTYSYGNIIKHVASVNFSYFFTPTTPQQWNNIQKRRVKDKNKYYYFIIDNYLYFPIPKNVDIPMEIVRMQAYFMDKREVDIFKSLKNCGDCKEKPEVCKSPLEYEMVIPSYLINDVKKELLRRLGEMFLRITPDDYTNLNSDKNSQRDIQNYEAP